jgi:hypothetical protein
LWQAIDSKRCPAPLGGTETGKSPVDRSKRGSKIHLLVDERGAPLAVCVTGANIYDKWLADDLIISIVVPRPDPDEVEQTVWTKAMIILTFTSLSNWRATSCISSMAVGAVNPSWRSAPCRAKPNFPLVVGRWNVPSPGKTTQLAHSLIQKSRQLAWFHSTRLFPHSLGYGSLWIDTKWKLFRPGEKAWYGSQINSRSERHTIASFIVVAEGVLIDRMQCSGIVDP